MTLYLLWRWGNRFADIPWKCIWVDEEVSFTDLSCEGVVPEDNADIGLYIFSGRFIPLHPRAGAEHGLTREDGIGGSYGVGI